MLTLIPDVNWKENLWALRTFSNSVDTSLLPWLKIKNPCIVHHPAPTAYQSPASWQQAMAATQQGVKPGLTKWHIFKPSFDCLSWCSHPTEYSVPDSKYSGFWGFPVSSLRLLYVLIGFQSSGDSSNPSSMLGFTVPGLHWYSLSADYRPKPSFFLMIINHFFYYIKVCWCYQMKTDASNNLH